MGEWELDAPKAHKKIAQSAHRLSLPLKEGAPKGRKIEWLAEPQLQHYPNPGSPSKSLMRLGSPLSPSSRT